MNRSSFVAAAVSMGLSAAAFAGGGVATETFITGLSSPIFVTNADDGSGRIFIVEQNGIIKVADASGNVNGTNFLNVSSISSCCGERGLLGLAFHPDYDGDTNRKFYINYTNNAGSTVVAEYETFSGLPDVANPSTARILLTIPQPFTNHNGGWIGFGPDGYLYISTGDGGSGGDPGNRSQDITNQLLGKMLRIDVDGSNSSNGQYGIPADNPFVGVTGDDEIWHVGLRNAWRNSFDRETGDFWIADVGQNAIEEINFQPASSSGGENWGWRCYEGNNTFNTSGCGPASNYDFPVHTFNHASGRCSVTGGYVYRGCAMPDMIGHYFFADYCSGQIWERDPDTGVVTELFNLSFGLTTFGEDEDGELYFAIGSTVTKLVPASFDDVNGNGVPDSCETFGCNEADIAEPFGTLDFSDVSAFLLAFSTSDPAADLAVPFGTWDFSDVAAFLASFGAGCP